MLPIVPDRDGGQISPEADPEPEPEAEPEPAETPQVKALKIRTYI